LHSSPADVAETSYICLAGTKQALTVRLVVRRVRPEPRQPHAPTIMSPPVTDCSDQCITLVTGVTRWVVEDPVRL
jgi:hypothetical protein